MSYFIDGKAAIMKWLNNYRDYYTLEKAVSLEIDSIGELLLHLGLYLENVNKEASSGKDKYAIT